MSRRRPAPSRRTRLHFESLEARRLLDCQGDPTTIRVNTFSDTVDADPQRTSLREAILAANNDTDCNLILLPEGSYRLTSEDPVDARGGDLNVFTKSGDAKLVTIRSQAGTTQPERTVIQGAWANERHRLFRIGADGSLALEGITLEGGSTSDHGGAIYSRGALSITNSVLKSHHADGRGGAVSFNPDDPDEKLVITNSLFQFNSTKPVSGGHGGAISHEGGKLRLTNSTLYSNSAGKRGGGLVISAGTATIENSTISTNAAGESGGGVYVSSAATAEINSSTIYANVAHGETAAGGIDAQGEPTSNGIVKLANSIVAGNVAWHEGFVNRLLDSGLNLRGGVKSEGGNLFGDVNGAVHPQVRDEPTVFDLSFRHPRLAELAYDGGLVPTHALLENSPAIGAAGGGGGAPTAFDQNGRPRGVDADIGAVEYDARRTALPGDTDADDDVDISDLNNVRNYFGAVQANALGDTDFDDDVDIVDLNNVRNHFGAVRQPSSAGPAERIDVTDWSRCASDRAYCATANDASEDTLAIQAAINEARVRGETHVVIPAGVYLVEGLQLQGYALGLTGTGALKLKANSTSYATLTTNPLGDTRGHLPQLALTRPIVMRDGFTPANWIDGVTIDGNAAAPHANEAAGLVIDGRQALISNVIVQNTAHAAGEDGPGGINVLVRGDHNVFSTVDSLSAGHTGFRNVGGENWYYDIAAHDFGCRGFRAQAPSPIPGGPPDVVGGPLYVIGADDQRELDFSTTADGSDCGKGGAPASILIDPVPVDDQDSESRISKVELRNLDVGGPNRIDDEIGQGNLLKFAAVENMLIESSRFTHTSPRLHSIRVAEGPGVTLATGGLRETGSIVIRDSWLARNLFFEDNAGEPRYKSIDLENVTIGEGFADARAQDRRHTIENVRVWDSFEAHEIALHGFSESGISWLIPSALEVTDSEFFGQSSDLVYGLALDPTFLPGLVQCSRFSWTDNLVSNSPGGALAVAPPPLFPCVLTPPPELSASAGPADSEPMAPTAGARATPDLRGWWPVATDDSSALRWRPLWRRR